jgi:DNA-binding NtrC family response regulator
MARGLHDFEDVMTHRILIADDDPSAREGLRRLLATWGYEVETASNGRAALDKTSVVHPEAVITDLRMPIMDGLQLLGALRHAEPSLPVIVITGHSDTLSVQRAAEQGAYAYLRKPVDTVKLKSVLVSALAKPSVPSATRSRTGAN